MPSASLGEDVTWTGEIAPETVDNDDEEQDPDLSPVKVKGKGKGKQVATRRSSKGSGKGSQVQNRNPRISKSVG